MKYRKKPVVIEAIQLTESSIPKIIKWCAGSYLVHKNSIYDLVIPTLEGDMGAVFGDFIIKGVQGEFYPCKPDIFEATYEKVN